MRSLIVISAPTQIVYESTVLTAIFGHGVQTLHLRKPGMSARETERLLKQIPSRYHNRIVLHAHYGLVDRYNLKGIHVSRAVRQQWPLFATAWKVRHPDRHVSTSFHEFSMLADYDPAYDYVFAGPVFAKPGAFHRPVMDKKLLAAAVRQSLYDVIALGGVTGGTLSELSGMGFVGGAVVNAIWKSEDPVETCIGLLREMEKAGASVLPHRTINIERPLGNAALKAHRM